MLPAISHSNVKYVKKGRSPNQNEDNYKMEATKQETNNVPERLGKWQLWTAIVGRQVRMAVER